MEVTEVVQFFFAVFVEVDEEVKEKKPDPLLKRKVINEYLTY